VNSKSSEELLVRRWGQWWAQQARIASRVWGESEPRPCLGVWLPVSLCHWSRDVFHYTSCSRIHV